MAETKPLTIHIYNNADKHRQRMGAIMEAYGVKTGPLIEMIIENLPDAEWEKYAKLAKESRTRAASPQVELAKAIRGMSDEDVAALVAGMQKMGIQVEANG